MSKDKDRLSAKEIGSRIKELNFPVESLAYLSGISEKRLNRIINGSAEFTLDEFLAFIKRTGISGDYLIGRLSKEEMLKNIVIQIPLE